MKIKQNLQQQKKTCKILNIRQTNEQPSYFLIFNSWQWFNNKYQINLLRSSWNLLTSQDLLAYNNEQNNMNWNHPCDKQLSMTSYKPAAIEAKNHSDHTHKVHNHRIKFVECGYIFQVYESFVVGQVHPNVSPH